MEREIEKYNFLPGEISAEALEAYKDGKIIFYREGIRPYFKYYWQREGESFKAPVDELSRAFAEYLLLDPPLSSLSDAELAAVYRGFNHYNGDILSEIARRAEESIPGITQAMEDAFSGDSKENPNRVIKRAIRAMKNIRDDRKHFRLCSGIHQISRLRPKRYTIEEWEDTDGEAWMDHGRAWCDGFDPEYLAFYDSEEEGLEALKDYTTSIRLVKAYVGYIVEIKFVYLEEYFIDDVDGEEVGSEILEFAPFNIDEKLLPEPDTDEEDEEEED